MNIASQTCLLYQDYMPNEIEIFAIGYSTHPIDKFIELLHAHEIKMLIDVRNIPKSKFAPDYNTEALKEHLKKAKIGYKHLKELGGLRRPSKDSVNLGWENLAFRGFADYMQTPMFQKGMEKLEKIAAKKRCVIMCAEGNPWRCHRKIIADALTVKGYAVLHIQSKKSAKLHALTPFLKIQNNQIIYPAKC